MHSNHQEFLAAQAFSAIAKLLDENGLMPKLQEWLPEAQRPRRFMEVRKFALEQLRENKFDEAAAKIVAMDLKPLRYVMLTLKKYTPEQMKAFEKVVPS